MYTKYSTRRFKIDHLNRIRALKKRYLSQGVEKTQEQILVEIVEEGLKIVETKRFVPWRAGEQMLRIAPIGIRDEEST